VKLYRMIVIVKLAIVAIDMHRSYIYYGSLASDTVIAGERSVFARKELNVRKHAH
jgi:hypothetical protein